MKKDIKIPQEWPGIHHIDHQEIDAVTRVLKDQSPFRFYGPKPHFETVAFEKDFAAFIGMEHCVMVSNGTTALQVALSALGVGPGDEVVMPGYFWVSTVGAVVRLGAVPVLADVDDSFNLDPDDLINKISDRTKVVIVVPMGGVIGQIVKTAEICKQRNIPLLEDCAQAAGASIFGQKCGSFGDMSIFSFQINKNMNSGEGGAVLTNDIHLYHRAFAIHDTGFIKAEDGSFVLDDPDLQLWGIGCRMSELAAAMGRVQLKKLPEITRRMRTFKNELKGILAQYNGISTRRVADPEGDSGGFLKIIFETRDLAYEFKDKLLNNGIKVEQGGFYPIHMEEWGLHIYFNLPNLVNKTVGMGDKSVWELEENSFAKDYQYGKGSLPNLDSYVERTVLFCIASNLNDDHKEIIRNAFVSSLEQMNFNKK
ncbi:DegT/DnrJ/EryC1/StrS family aminotransferase [Bacteroidota bacterium]